MAPTLASSSSSPVKSSLPMLLLSSSSSLAMMSGRSGDTSFLASPPSRPVPSPASTDDDERSHGSAVVMMKKPSPKRVASLLREMQKVLDEGLDATTKREYQAAVELVPHLVQTETPLIIFLRTDDYDPRRGARRLALYWKERCRIFDDRWLLPMDQTGRGALNALDVQFLQTGFKVSVELEGLGTFSIIDPSRGISFREKAARNGWDMENIFQRCSFYQMTVNTTENMQSFGETMIHVVTAPRKSPQQPLSQQQQQQPSAAFRRNMWDIWKMACPIKYRQSVIVQAYQPDKQALLEFVRFRIAKIVEFNSQQAPTQVFGHSTASTLQQLMQTTGMGRDVLPLEVGGNLCTKSKFADWTRMRLSIEELTYHTKPTSGDASTSLLPRALQVATTQNWNTLGGEPMIKRKKGESAKAFAKRRDAMYSRRLYHKRKMAKQAYQQQVDELQQRHAELQAEHKRLQDLWTKAESCVRKWNESSTVRAGGGGDAAAADTSTAEASALTDTPSPSLFPTTADVDCLPDVPSPRLASTPINSTDPFVVQPDACKILHAQQEQQQHHLQDPPLQHPIPFDGLYEPIPLELHELTQQQQGVHDISIESFKCGEAAEMETALDFLAIEWQGE